MSADGKRGAVGGKDGNRVWDLTRGQVVSYLNSQHGSANGGFSVPDGKLALTKFMPTVGSDEWPCGRGHRPNRCASGTGRVADLGACSLPTGNDLFRHLEGAAPYRMVYWEVATGQGIVETNRVTPFDHP